MKSIKHLLLLASVILSACSHNSSGLSEAKMEETGTTEHVTTRIVQEDIAYPINNMHVVGDRVLCVTDVESPVYIAYDAKHYGKVKEFGTIGHGHNEWQWPDIVERGDKDYDIFDNGKKRIQRYHNDTLVSEMPWDEMVAVNDMHRINDRYSGYSYLTPGKATLYIYDADTYECTDKYVISDEKHADKSSYILCEWDGDANHIVMAHIFKKELYVMELDRDGKVAQGVKYVGDYDFNPEKHVYYSTVSVSNGRIYLLSQQHIDLEKMSGYSEIDIFDISGRHIRRLELDVMAACMCVVDDVIWLLDTDNNIRIYQGATK